jgi:hypothetical protein
MLTGGVAPYTYNWKQNASGTTFSANANLTNLFPANYQLVITDASSCTTSPVVTQQVNPVTVTRFTQEVIADGANASSSSVTSTTIDQNPAVYFMLAATPIQAVQVLILYLLWEILQARKLVQDHINLHHILPTKFYYFIPLLIHQLVVQQREH